MARQRAEIDKIAADPAKPTFDNTIVAMERSGQMLDRVSAVFFGLAGANTNPVLQGTEMAEGAEAGRAPRRHLSRPQTLRPGPGGLRRPGDLGARTPNRSSWSR